MMYWCSISWCANWAYTSDCRSKFADTLWLSDLLDRHVVQSHLYTDDTQLCASCQPDDASIFCTRLSHCTGDVTQWCTSHRFQLNANKTEIICVGWIMCKHKEIVQPRAIHPSWIREDQTSKSRLRSRRATWRWLSTKKHIAKVSVACYCQLSRLCQIRRRVGAEVVIWLVLACAHYV